MEQTLYVRHVEFVATTVKTGSNDSPHTRLDANAVLFTKIADGLRRCKNEKGHVVVALKQAHCANGGFHLQNQLFLRWHSTSSAYVIVRSDHGQLKGAFLLCVPKSEVILFIASLPLGIANGEEPRSVFTESSDESSSFHSQELTMTSSLI